uniref:Dynein heavy chain 2, axonemal n=1 Tax=Magallana gigas TaxID=29159 RepID=K1QL86_MAGGI
MGSGFEKNAKVWGITYNWTDVLSKGSRGPLKFPNPEFYSHSLGQRQDPIAIFSINILGQTMSEDKLKPSLAKMFSVMHKSVWEYSKKMLAELRRHNYVTPTNYLELVSGYKKLLFDKKNELGGAADKLRNGLSKIDDTRQKVEKMSIELEDAKTKVAQFQKQCDEYLVIIVQQKREADEQQKVTGAK